MDFILGSSVLFVLNVYNYSKRNTKVFCLSIKVGKSLVKLNVRSSTLWCPDRRKTIFNVHFAFLLCIESREFLKLYFL